MRQAALLEALKSIVGEAFVITNAADMETYMNEERGLFHGTALAVVRPASTIEVAEVVKACVSAWVAIVPQGGNTGLVGGAVADGQVILSMGRMNRIRAVNPEGFTMTVEAGCILEDIRNAAEAEDRLFPLSLGAQGSCQIGGNIATNVGGINTLRYGTARDNVLGLEVVLPDGRVWNGLRALTKDNTGYSLRNLFVGSEGTLGIVTAAVLKLYPKPVAMETAFCGLPDLDAVLPLLERARRASGDQVSAFEVICRTGVEMSTTYLEGVSDPLESPHPWYALVEFSSANSDDPLRETFERFLEGAFEEGIIVDAVIAESLEQRRMLWRIREELPEAQKYEGGSIKHDVSVPVRSIPEFIRRASEAVVAVVPGARPVPFGHAGDGNIHFNVSQPVGMDTNAYLAQWHVMSKVVYDIVDELGGSFSAEHGVGRLKVEYLARYRSDVELDLMRRIKAAFDPKGTMNPGVFFG
ncbi:MAG: FAD-binding oxidoreductase [Rhodospirillaceae bacterium]|nr:FAD-binding oxidoreductase [Rhodospirillaceae bacterium]